MAEDDFAFFDRVDFNFQTQLLQVLAEAIIEQGLAIAPFERAQISAIVGAELEIFQPLTHQSLSARDRETAAKRQRAKALMKTGLPVVQTVFPIAIGHRQLIQIVMQRAAFHHIFLICPC